MDASQTSPKLSGAKQPFIVLMDSVGQRRNLDSERQGQLGSVSPCLGPQMEDLKARGWNHLQSHSLLCLVADPGCGLRP